MDSAPLDLTVRIGCRMTYEAKDSTAGLFMIKPRRDEGPPRVPGALFG